MIIFDVYTISLTCKPRFVDLFKSEFEPPGASLIASKSEPGLHGMRF